MYVCPVTNMAAYTLTAYRCQAVALLPGRTRIRIKVSAVVQPFVIIIIADRSLLLNIHNSES